MRFWIRPPNKKLTVFLFRIFFALCLIGSVNGFVRQIQRQPLTRQNIVGTLLTAAIMCGVVGTMTTFAVWMAERRERRGTDMPGA